MTTAMTIFVTQDQAVAAATHGFWLGRTDVLVVTGIGPVDSIEVLDAARPMDAALWKQDPSEKPWFGVIVQQKN